MEFHPVLQAGPFTQTVATPEFVAQRLFIERGPLLKSLEDTVRPFRFTVARVSDGAELSGDRVAVMFAAAVLEHIAAYNQQSQSLDLTTIDDAIATISETMLKREFAFRFEGMFSPVRPASFAQIAFMKLLLAKDEKLLFGIGPTGTGKTHLAIAAGINMLAEERINHLVITRPHVLLEGEVVTAATRQETQYDEQFKAIEDALEALIGYDTFDRLAQRHKIEITPLGQLRGRTFNKALVIVDDAQNLTKRKMRMVVTRLGQGSRMVLTGDPSQVDLRSDEPSGLPHILNLVQGTDLAAVFKFERSEIIRNPIVARLENLYAQEEGGRPSLAA